MAWRHAIWGRLFGELRGPIGQTGARLTPVITASYWRAMAAGLDPCSHDELLDVGCRPGRSGQRRCRREVLQRAIRLASSTAVAMLLLVSSTIVLGQEGADVDGPQYFYGEAEGYLHPNEDNPLGCDIGMTSESTLYGESPQFGAVTISQVNCYVPTDTLDNIQLVTSTYTFEDGATLTGTGSGDCIPDDVLEPGGFYSCWGTTTITGGTGDFEGASGVIHAIAYTFNAQSDHPDALPGDNPATTLFEGLIEY